jgi:hypothetical protein
MGSQWWGSWLAAVRRCAVWGRPILALPAKEGNGLDRATGVRGNVCLACRAVWFVHDTHAGRCHLSEKTQFKPLSITKALFQSREINFSSFF